MAWMLRLGLDREAVKRADDATARALILELARSEESALRAELLGTPDQIVAGAVVHQAARCALGQYIRCGVDPDKALRRTDRRTEDEALTLAEMADRVAAAAAAPAPSQPPKPRRNR